MPSQSSYRFTAVGGIMRVLEITAFTVLVFVAAVVLYAFFPIAITILGLISIGLVAREIGYHYDEVYQKEARDKQLDQAHQRVKVIRLKHNTHHTSTKSA